MPADPPTNDRRTPAWIVSTLIHAGLLVLAFFFVQAAPRGAADEAGRQVGVVLKKAGPDGALYEGPQTDAPNAEATDASATDASESTADALPDAAAERGFEALLPQPLGLGAATAGSQTPTAGQMTEGGAGATASVAGGAARVSVFGVEGEGRRFVYVFDRSFSMNGAPLAAAKQQLLQSLASLGPTHQFQIVFFNFRSRSPDLTAGQGRIAFADERSKRIAENFVGGIAADGGSNRLDALQRALAMGPDVVFFLTDEDNAMTGAELEKIARQNRRVGATICTIEFGRGPEHGRPNFLVQLASMTGGQYGYVDTTRLGRN